VAAAGNRVCCAAGDGLGSHRAEAVVVFVGGSDCGIEEFAGGSAGADEEHVDAAGGEFGAEGIGKSVERELAGAVFAFVGDGAVAKDGADVDDDRFIAGAEQGKGFADEFDGGEKIDLHNLAEAGFVGLVEGAEGTDASVVDEAIEAAEFALGEFEGGAAVGGVGDVAGEAAVVVGLSDFGGEGCQSVGAAAEGKDASAAVYQFDGERAADAAGGTGEDGSESGEGAAWHSLTVSRHCWASQQWHHTERHGGRSLQRYATSSMAIGAATGCSPGANS
jgi:hypothetical protein